MMFFRKTPDAAGDYVDAVGVRYSICVARRIRTSDGVNVGYASFASLQDALDEWGLSTMEQEVRV